MAMSRICALGAVVLAQASTADFDYDRYVKQFAGDYGKYASQGPRNGEFSDYVQRYADGYASYERKSAGNYSQDRVAQAKEFEGRYAGDFEGKYAPQSGMGRKYLDRYTEGPAHDASLAASASPAAPQVAVLVEAPAPKVNATQAPAPKVNATQEVEEAVTAMQKATARAEGLVVKLRSWDAGMKANVHSKAFAVNVAEGILTKVQTDYDSQRQRLNGSFSEALKALDPATLATANSSTVKTAVDSAKAIIKQIRHLNTAEAKHMRSTLDDISKAGKAKAKTLWKAAKLATKEVYHTGMNVSRAQRKAGMHEGVYERQEGKAEEVSERLEGHAEEAFEKAEDLFERQYDKVEHYLEKEMDAMGHEEHKAIDSLSDRLDHAKEVVEWARKAAKEAAKEKAASPAASPAVFLARSSPQDSGTTAIAPLACAVMMAAMGALLVARGCRQGLPAERPLLG